MTKTEVVIVGAGPAGLGCAALLKQMGIEDNELLVLEKGEIGQTFLDWPESMRFITPSFPSNGYHQTDLNAITPDTSPAFTTGKEHLNGKEYAKYLSMVAQHYNIKIETHTFLKRVIKLPDQDGFELKTDLMTIRCNYLIWAGGEYHSPNMSAFAGAELCKHNSEISLWNNLDKGDYIVIGGYESGVDAAYNLAKSGNKVTILDFVSNTANTYDPSLVLSPYTAERLANLSKRDNVELDNNFRVNSVEIKENNYVVTSSCGKIIVSKYPPINCTGFDINLGPVSELFHYQVNGYPSINKFDESSKARNLFLAGSRLFHDPTLLCFIYKFRGRFFAPCSVIGEELALDMSILRHYKQSGMILNDLNCCVEQECFC
jgi:thioredoxin reductase